MRFLILLLFFLSGCASLSTVTTTVTDPDQQIWTVHSKKDALVKLTKPDGTILEVDNRGAAGFFETYMQYLLIQAAPNVELSNQPRED